jgi:carboxymethylenebutenolidase
MSAPAYVSTPVRTGDRPGPWPGVVVVHDVFGMTDDVREQADWLAAAGYLAAVPDLYGGKGVLRCVKGAFAQLSAQRGPMFDRLDAARRDLAGSPDCTGTVGVIGYCMGGGFALLLAGRPGWSAASVNYGEVPDNVAEVLADGCPVVASYGGRDRSLPGAAAKLKAAAPSADVKEYPDAGHSFLNRLAVASPLVPVMRVAGVGYHHPSAADAKRRILSFFDTHLRGAA